MKRGFIVGLAVVTALLAATYGAWYTGKLGPVLRSVGLESAAQLAELTQVGMALEKDKTSQAPKSEATEADQSADSTEHNREQNAMEEAVGLALKGINLVQGEQGLELWRLKATWASLREEGGQIDVEMPDMVYRVGEAEIPLHVTAKKGQVTQNQKFLRLWEDVVCTYDDYTLRATLMTYDSETRVMTFPEGAHVESAKNKGFAHVLTWDLTTNMIEGRDGVTISW